MAVLRGKWWEIFGDPALNALEEQVNISNQNVLAGRSQLPRGAEPRCAIARSALLSVGFGVAFGYRFAALIAPGSPAPSTPYATLEIPVSASYTL